MEGNSSDTAYNIQEKFLLMLKKQVQYNYMDMVNLQYLLHTAVL